MNEILLAAIPAAGWGIHAGLLSRMLRAERRDPVSGLWTRRPWMRRTERLIRQGRITHVILLDLDRFKPINDDFGHPAGDAVLKATGGRLDDFVDQNGGPRSMSARLGGDEFVAAISIRDQDLQGFIDDLAHELAQPVPWPGGPLQVDASIGAVGVTDVPEPSASTVLKAADDEMYVIKKSRGRNGRRAHRRVADPTASPETALHPAQEARASA
ncbi:GGDEF domain-containing protein [Streptomyces capitiformicae]|uniref:GGDEF domain-containing protein n=1 Tax=Streptomyces capitiformicae TaxID=2014920 RepID=A0A918Z319_9ACTN|nr:GGDEF domain-containing protein [Streptomyces capitiformicae]GHE34195.1 GGDEF domain-containing protein [Streptomyces capitiformicae]